MFNFDYLLFYYIIYYYLQVIVFLFLCFILPDNERERESSPGIIVLLYRRFIVYPGGARVEEVSLVYPGSSTPGVPR